VAEYGTSVVSTAPADKVWRVWSDTSTWGEWNPNVSTMELTGPFATGSTAIMHTKAGQHHKMKLVDVQQGRSFVLETSVIPGTTFRFNCGIEPVGAETRLSQTVEVKGPLGFLGRMLGPGVSKDFGTLLSNLAKRAETA
jgi:hypothetical protein